MRFAEKESIVRRFVDEVNLGNLDIVDELIAPEFFNHVPAAGEETAPEVLRPLVNDFLGAFPDFRIEVANFVDEGENLTFTATISGTRSGALWGAPGMGQQGSLTSTFTSRFADGKFAFQWKDLSIPSVIGALRSIGMVPPPDKMDQPPKYPVSVPDFVLKLLYTGQAGDKPCDHLDLIQVVDTDVTECEQCVASGDVWPALRMCLVCGFVGCCDTSKNKHMKQHYETTGHPIFRSIRLDESWVWCYEDNALFSGRILEKYR